MKRKQQDKDFIDKKFNLTILDALDEKEVDNNLINIDRALSGSNHSNSSIHSHNNNNNNHHQTNNNSRHTNNLSTNDHIDSRSRRHLHVFFSDTQYNNRDYDYEDYHRQVYVTNWCGIARGASLVWLPPVLLTIVIYAYTMCYIRCHVSKFTLL
ncbi:unnamed protein product [Rotaria sordida]|uniref:Uncharacterized protein n=1 Tax=Rotaria sordida TaxID=392033 RepID=A0A819SQH9_9BILA|nr:unnamed protein product [Rotaria sordida]